MQALLRFLGYACAIVCLVLLLLSGPLYQLELVSFGLILKMLKIVVPIGLAAILLLLIARLTGAVKNRAIFLMIILAAVLYLPISNALTVKSLPYIHDITTDTTNTPAFSEIMMAARSEARNPPEYLAGEVTEKQQEAYPDIQPLLLEADLATSLERVRATVNKMGWDLVSDKNDRIEATDTSFWFGFKDDVIIRLQSAGDKTRIDMRSKSRIGESDIGANANRIRSFFKALQSN